MSLCSDLVCRMWSILVRLTAVSAGVSKQSLLQQFLRSGLGPRGLAAFGTMLVFMMFASWLNVWVDLGVLALTPWYTLYPCILVYIHKKERYTKLEDMLNTSAAKYTQSCLSSGDWLMYALPLKCMFVNNNGGEPGRVVLHAVLSDYLFIYLFSWLLPPCEWRRRQHKSRHVSQHLCHCLLKTTRWLLCLLP